MSDVNLTVAPEAPPTETADPLAVSVPATETTNLCPECGKPYIGVASTYVRAESDPTRFCVLYQHREFIDSTGKQKGREVKSSGCLSDTAPADTSANLPEIISPKTPPDISNPTNVANEEEIAQLEREIDDKATEIIGHFTNRIEYELLPLLYRMKSLLPHGEWGKWYERFRKRVRLNWTMRTVQRKFRELEDGWNDDPDAEEIGEGEPADEELDEGHDALTLALRQSPKESLKRRITEIKTVLSQGSAPVDTNPLRDGERRVSRALELLEETELAVDEGLLDKLPEDCGGCQHMHRGIVALAKVNPDWTDERLAEEIGNNVITVRQARTRFMVWEELRHDC